MKSKQFEKLINYFVIFLSIYSILDILRIYYFRGEIGISFGDYELNYLSRFFYSFNLPINDIKILIFTNISIFSILTLLSLVSLRVIEKSNKILQVILFILAGINAISILKTIYTILISEKMPSNHKIALIFTTLIYIIFEIAFIYILKRLKNYG